MITCHNISSSGLELKWRRVPLWYAMIRHKIHEFQHLLSGWRLYVRMCYRRGLVGIRGWKGWETGCKLNSNWSDLRTFSCTTNATGSPCPPRPISSVTMGYLLRWIFYNWPIHIICKFTFVFVLVVCIQILLLPFMYTLKNIQHNIRN
jgi:hypothetical protein